MWPRMLAKPESSTRRGSAAGRQYVMVALGRENGTTDDVWRSAGFISQIIRLESATPSGFRFGSRACGLGWDSLRIAVKVLLSGQRGPMLASNPWVGVALRLTGQRDVSVTGIYAEPGTCSHRILRLFLRNSAIVTLLAREAESWNNLGGRAKAVVYGNTFGYPSSSTTGASPQQIRIFIGGMSDRDTSAVQSLEEEVRASPLPIQLTITAREGPSSVETTVGVINHTGWVTPDAFGRSLASADVVFLPLAAVNRAAGHMVAVGSLEVGTPVVSTRSAAMGGYIDGTHIRFVDESSIGVLDQLVEVARQGRQRRADNQAFWADFFSLDAYVARVGAALSELDRTLPPDG